MVLAESSQPQTSTHAHHKVDSHGHDSIANHHTKHKPQILNNTTLDQANKLTNTMMQHVTSPGASDSLADALRRCGAGGELSTTAPCRLRTSSSSHFLYTMPSETRTHTSFALSSFNDSESSTDESTEPPLSANGEVVTNEKDLQEIAKLDSLHRIRPSRISPLVTMNLEASPLTESTPQVLEREYDRDTWRMYNRIHSARSSGTSCPARTTTLLLDTRCVTFTSSTIQSDGEDSCSSSIDDAFSHTSGEGKTNYSYEDDVIFQLDLEE